MCSIIFWIVVCGVAGGFRNLLNDLRQAETHKWLLVFQRLVEGIVASATVPLFLSLIGNDIVSTILTAAPGDKGEPGYAILRFAGFCFIAAIYSRNFLDNLSSKVMQLQKEVEKTKKNTDEKLEKISETVEAAVVEDDRPLKLDAAHTRNQTALSENERAILKAFLTGRYPIRSVEGLILSTGLPEGEVLTALSSLEGFGLVRSLGTRHGKRWTATQSGLDAVR